MHPPAFLLLLFLLLNDFGLAIGRPKAPALSDEEKTLWKEQLEAFKAQKPIHTTALLAGAAAMPTSASRNRGNEKDEWDDDVADEDVEVQLIVVQRREGWEEESAA